MSPSSDFNTTELTVFRGADGVGATSDTESVSSASSAPSAATTASTNITIPNANPEHFPTFLTKAGVPFPKSRAATFDDNTTDTTSEDAHSLPESLQGASTTLPANAGAADDAPCEPVTATADVAATRLVAAKDTSSKELCLGRARADALRARACSAEGVVAGTARKAPKSYGQLGCGVPGGRPVQPTPRRHTERVSTMEDEGDEPAEFDVKASVDDTLREDKAASPPLQVLLPSKAKAAPTQSILKITSSIAIKSVHSVRFAMDEKAIVTPSHDEVVARQAIASARVERAVGPNVHQPLVEGAISVPRRGRVQALCTRIAAHVQTIDVHSILDIFFWLGLICPLISGAGMIIGFRAARRIAAAANATHGEVGHMRPGELRTQYSMLRRSAILCAISFTLSSTICILYVICLILPAGKK